MRLPRFRVRALMIAVAAVALALTGTHQATRLYQLWQDHRKWVEYSSMEKGLLTTASRQDSHSKQAVEFYKSTGQSHWAKHAKDTAGTANQCKQLASEFARKKMKYQHAANFPW